MKCIFFIFGFLFLAFFYHEGLTKETPSPLETMLVNFDKDWPHSSYVIATVQTEKELWNVYIFFTSLDEIALHQSRQDSESEYVMIGEDIWHTEFNRTTATIIGPQWKWFLRTQSIFRFADFLKQLSHVSKKSESEQLISGCRLYNFIDASRNAVRICIRPTGLPTFAELESPSEYGGQMVRFNFLEWAKHNGNWYPSKYDQISKGVSMSWEIQSILDLPKDQARLTPPE